MENGAHGRVLDGLRDGMRENRQTIQSHVTDCARKSERVALELKVLKEDVSSLKTTLKYLIYIIIGVGGAVLSDHQGLLLLIRSFVN